MRREKIKSIDTNVYLKKEDLEKMHSKQLIEIRHIISKHENELGIFDEDLEEWFMYKWEDSYGIYVNVSMLNDVLKTHSPYPSKKENIAIKRLIARDKYKTKHKIKHRNY